MDNRVFNYESFLCDISNVRIEGSILTGVIGKTPIAGFVNKRPHKDFTSRYFTFTAEFARNARMCRCDFIIVQDIARPKRIILIPLSLEARKLNGLRPVISRDEHGEKVFIYKVHEHEKITADNETKTAV